ncbi:MAG: ABC transporter permease subunit [Actinobacteria bacterium]|nr:ABC transporter permease subunit [Actinomycetota bacterium]MSY54342.1 ABC transporter permease subunit [Actinomycetota bacterium]
MLQQPCSRPLGRRSNFVSITIAKRTDSLKTGVGPLHFAHRISSFKSLLPLLPFFAFVAYFLVFPLTFIVRDAFLDNDGKFTFSNFAECFKGVYGHSFFVSIQLSLISAAIGAVAGSLIAGAIVKTGTKSRRAIAATASVLANTGGVPLAFMFLAGFGSEGLVTKALKFLGWDLYAGSFTLFSATGIVLVYSFFQIPLMVLIYSPALENVKPEWREASDSLGGTRVTYFLRVTVPLLFPAFLSTSLLLFANSFSAYATARAMTSGTLPLMPLLIGNLVDGNVIANQQHLGHAMAVCMVGVSIIVMSIYVLVLRFSKVKR